MNATSIVFLAIAVTVALLPGILILHTANLAHSLFRMHLWSTRDALMDDILARRFKDAKQADNLLRLMETYIYNVGRHSVLDVVLATIFMRRENSPLQQLAEECLDAADRQRLSDHYKAFARVCERHLLASSPSGWLTLGLLCVRRSARRAWPQVQEFRGRAVEVEVKAMPHLAPSGQRSRFVPNRADLLDSTDFRAAVSGAR